MSEHTCGTVILDEVVPLGRAPRRVIPDRYKGYAAFSAAACASGALDTKTNELIALGIAITLHCDGRIASHARGASAVGAELTTEVAEL